MIKKIPTIWIFVVAFVLVAIAIIVFTANTFYPEDKLPIVIIKNVFLDVNGDGKIDYVKSMEAIINQGNLPLQNQGTLDPNLTPSP